MIKYRVLRKRGELVDCGTKSSLIEMIDIYIYCVFPIIAYLDIQC